MSPIPFLLALAGPLLPVRPQPALTADGQRGVPIDVSIDRQPAVRLVDDEDDAQADGNKLVKVSLVADRAEVQPGSTFTIAVRARVERRWHVYWGENPGDSGLPLTMEITGPDGWRIGPLRHPWPKREELEGDIVSYILSGEVVMLADVEVPPDAQAGTQAAFAVKGSWLVCTTVCVAGSGSATLTLPVAEKEKPANEAEFKTWRARLPRPWSEMTRTMSSWSGTARAPRMTLIVPGATALEFFPYTSPTTTMRSRQIEIGKQGATLTLDLKFEAKEPDDAPAARGVLWIETEKGAAAYVLDILYRKP